LNSSEIYSLTIVLEVPFQPLMRFKQVFVFAMIWAWRFHLTQSE